jgi:hypothetical protein
MFYSEGKLAKFYTFLNILGVGTTGVRQSLGKSAYYRCEHLDYDQLQATPQLGK